LGNKDTENKSYRHLFFIGIALLSLMFLKTFSEEFSTRRPWKHYQKAFYDQQRKKASRRLQEAHDALEKNSEHKKLLELIDRAEAEFNRPEVQRDYNKASKNLKRAEVELFEIAQEFNFSKAEEDEAFYEWKHALHQRPDVDGLKGDWEALAKQTESLLVEVDEAQNGKAEAEKNLKRFTAELELLQDEKEGMEADLLAAESSYNSTYDQINLAGFTIKSGKSPKIQQVVVEELELVDRCHSCHAGIDKAGFEAQENPHKTHPDRELYLGNHPVEKFGCTVCHHGQGRALASVESAHGNIEHWEKPMLEGGDIQSSCRKCHEQTLNLEGAPLLNRGKKAIIQFGCYGCHDIKGLDHFDKVGPDLRRIGIKVTPEWAYYWINNPQGYAPKTRMPNFLLNEDEVPSILAYLFSASDNEDVLDFPSTAPEGDPLKGKEVFEKAGCSACHKIDGRGATTSADYTRQFAPDLGKVGSKASAAWLAYWIRNPKRYNPKTKMPKPRISEEEISDVVAYLSGLKGEMSAPEDLRKTMDDPEQIKRGERLIIAYGCFGCHQIKGMEDVNKVSVELGTFGSKTVDELAFGDEVDIPQTWDAWTSNKLKNPRAYETEAVVQRMPQFYMSDEEASFIRIVLKSFRDEEIHPDFKETLHGKKKLIEDGRWLAWYYNCTGCHILENKGGDIRDLYEDAGFAPPPLYDEGAKTQSNWLYGFIQAPSTLRPWLKVQMPDFAFTDEQTSTLVHYFLALDDIDIPFNRIEEKDPASDEMKTAKELFEMLKCIQCHQLDTGSSLSPSDLAPDLALARKRLRPGWIEQWLLDPQVLYPDTRMPTYFPSEDEDEPDSPLSTPFEDAFDGDARKQIKAISDYLMVIDESS
jgi:mono/diheme cytochrome c family protein